MQRTRKCCEKREKKQEIIAARKCALLKCSELRALYEQRALFGHAMHYSYCSSSAAQRKGAESAEEGVQSSEPDEWPSPNRRNAHNLRGFLSALHCTARNNHKHLLRRKQRDKQRTRRSNEKIEPESDKSASSFPPQDRIQRRFLRRHCIPKVACVALVRTRKSAEARRSP